MLHIFVIWIFSKQIKPKVTSGTIRDHLKIIGKQEQKKESVTLDTLDTLLLILSTQLLTDSTLLLTTLDRLNSTLYRLSLDEE